MTNTDDDITTITPSRCSHPDDEVRNFIAFDEAMRAALHYLKNIAVARENRGAPIEDLEGAQDTLNDLRLGFARAHTRRVRDLGTLLNNTRMRAVR